MPPTTETPIDSSAAAAPELLGNDPALETLLDFDGRPEDSEDIPAEPHLGPDATPTPIPATPLKSAPTPTDAVTPAPATTPNDISPLPVVPTTPATPTTSTTTPQETSQLPASRDYSEFTAEEAALLQRMSNDAFAFVTQRFNEYKTKLNDATEKIKARDIEQNNVYYDPYGYVRDKAFADKMDIVDNAKADIAHYRAQLEAINQGKEWIGYVQGADGKPVAVRQEASPEAAANVQQFLASCYAKLTVAESEANAYKNNWATKSQNYRKFFQDQEDKYFPAYKGKEAEHPHIKHMTGLLQGIGQVNNPLTSIFSKLYANLMDLSEAYKQSQAKIASLEAAKTVKTATLPSTSQVTAAATATTSKAAATPATVYDEEEYKRIYES